MPRALRTDKRKRRALSMRQKLSLMIGDSPRAKRTGGGAFESDAARRAAWFQWRDEFLTQRRGKSLPAAFYDYEVGQEKGDD